MQTIEKYIDPVLINHQSFIRGLNRLKGITGFVSIIGDDPRINIFNRYNHVIRVINLTHYLSSLQNQIDTDRCILLVLLHDINRLPFAHLLEKRIDYHQDDYFEQYFDLINLNLDLDIIVDLKDIMKKNTNGSKEATLVFLADSIDGFIEDSLFAFSIFNLNPNNISSTLINQLGYNNLSNFSECLATLKEKFAQNNDLTSYFNDRVLEYSINFIAQHRFSDISSIDFNKFHEIRQDLKSNLLISEIFPINNEKVSKGNYLYINFMLPYLRFQKNKHNDVVIKLLQMTDKEMLFDAEKNGVLKCMKEDLYPVLK
jgi:5'-deoxynucleotidase YfbR-like HD superfamily hydrolase